MLAFLDLLPVVIFFVVFKFYDIYSATMALIAATAVVVLAHWLINRTVSKMLLVSAGFAALLGGLTLYLRDPVFLQWKPTIVYWIFAAALLITDFVSPRNLIARALDESIPADPPTFRKLNMVWVTIFIVMGILNLYIASKYSMETWVTFKLWAAFGVTLLGMAITMGFLYRLMPEEETEKPQE